MHTSTGSNINLRFPGQWFQLEAGLYQNWMRDYDPTTGRYIQADPLGLVDGPSIYGYALQNPGRYVDPRGEFIPVAVGIAIGGAYGYYTTGCWQGAVAGAAIGAVGGAIGAPLAAALSGNTIGAGALIGGGATALSQIVNNELAEYCGCSGDRVPLKKLVVDPEFWFNNAIGVGGGTVGATIGASNSIITVWARSQIGKQVIARTISGITSKTISNAPKLGQDD